MTVMIYSVRRSICATKTNPWGLQMSFIREEDDPTAVVVGVVTALILLMLLLAV